MTDRFFESPILNSPYRYPARHWELDEHREPTGRVVDTRRPASYITAVPKPRVREGAAQQSLALDEGAGLSGERQQYDPTSTINALRGHVDRWRELPESDWAVTPETARLLKHWRHHTFSDIRPFFCQLEAVETVIWLTEVAPRRRDHRTRDILDHLDAANEEANPTLARLALKLATGAGKTTVMAMLIAWQTVNAVRRPASRNFTKGFLIVTPGLTIRDRLRVLQPNDPGSYYQSRELVPRDMLADIERARIVVTNYHAFKRRETLELSKGGRSLLRGRGPEIESIETEGQMLQRVIPELLGMRSILAFNDEAHHCYREKPGESAEEELKGDDREEAKRNREAARLWIGGLEAVSRKLGLRRVIDLSATPFFLRGSGYAEGTLFPWTMSDFSLMDAIECGIVKLPRVPVADNVSGTDGPVFRNLWGHIGSRMPRQGRRQAGALDPLSIPVELQTALDAVYGHYAETFELWEQAGVGVPPCFIVVCNNTATSKLVYDYISGFFQERQDGTKALQQGRLALLRNFDENGEPYARPRTLLIDSQQLESGEGLDKTFRAAAAAEIERFRREQVQRTGDRAAAEQISDADLLREVMNTVGKPGQLGESIRCVVSVAMLSEGWDANTVTHVLGVRAFGTQLLCEQVIGRALRRQSYDLNDEDLFDVEYADVLGIPFDFTAEPVVAPPQPPRRTVQVHAVSPERDELEIRFPRVAGYRVELPDERLDAAFTDDSTFVLTPEHIGPTVTRNEGIIGTGIDLDVDHLGDLRLSTIAYLLTGRLLETKWRDPAEAPKLHLFGQLKRITRRWLDEHLVCEGGTYPAQLMYQSLADIACERITAGITRRFAGKMPVKAVLDPYNPAGSTRQVRFATSKQNLWQTHPGRSHVNWAVCDSEWEGEFCRVAESHPRVRAYVKNQGLGLEVPYRIGSESHRYLPDFVVLVDDGRGADDPLHLVVEVKGYRGEDAKEKKATMETYWVPGVNNLGGHGRWSFAEFTDRYTMAADFAALVEAVLAGGHETSGSPAPLTAEKVLALLREHKPAIVARFGVVDIALFGSTVRDEAKPDSDIDVLVRLDERPGWTRPFDLEAYLEELLGRPVDLVVEPSLRSEIRPNVEAEAIHV
ncbi:MAG: nucleotidyltransferase domain-containing protein [bacterium]|nr:nucleotidyltransferase domain-containing protein [bacterium]